MLGRWGRWRSIKRVEVGVRKHETCAEEKASMRRRYLRGLAFFGVSSPS